MSEYKAPNKGIISKNGSKSVSLPQSDISRVLPRQLSTGTTRGTQTVGYGSAKIDGSNNRITIGAPDGSSIGIGLIPGSTTDEYGFFSLDANGRLIMKIVNGTWYVYNPNDTTVNVMQSGILPDGTGGWAVAAEGYSVDEGF